MSRTSSGLRKAREGGQVVAKVLVAAVAAEPVSGMKTFLLYVTTPARPTAASPASRTRRRCR
jgi:hypothetical protein